jgi:hypothetical protein
LKDPVTPEPRIAPDLDEAECAHTFERRFKIVHNVLGPILIWLCRDPAMQEATWLQSTLEFLDRFYGLAEIFEDIHGRDDIEALV